MKKTGLYPGSFDCFTLGHLDVAKRALQIFDELYIAVAVNTRKKSFFSVEERISQLREIFQDNPRVKVIQFSSLTVQKAQELDVSAIVRGLRAVSDFEYEFQMAMANRNLAREIETIFLMSDERFMYVSSSLAKEIAFLGGDASAFLPPVVNRALIGKVNQLKQEGSS